MKIREEQLRKRVLKCIDAGRRHADMKSKIWISAIEVYLDDYDLEVGRWDDNEMATDLIRVCKKAFLMQVALTIACERADIPKNELIEICKQAEEESFS